MRMRSRCFSGAVAPASGQRRKSRKGLSRLAGSRPSRIAASSFLINSLYSRRPTMYSENTPKIGVVMRVVAWRLMA